MSAPEPPNPQQPYQGPPSGPQPQQDNPFGDAPQPTEVVQPGQQPPQTPGDSGAAATQMVNPVGPPQGGEQGPSGEATQMVPPGMQPPPYTPPPSAQDAPGGHQPQQPQYGQQGGGFSQQPPQFGQQPQYGQQPQQYGPPGQPGQFGGPPQGPGGPGGFGGGGFGGPSGPPRGQLMAWIGGGIIAVLGLVLTILALTLVIDVLDTPAGPDISEEQIAQCEQFAEQSGQDASQCDPGGGATEATIYSILMLLGSGAALAGGVLLALRKNGKMGIYLALGGAGLAFLAALIFAISLAGIPRTTLTIVFGILIALVAALGLFPQTAHFIGIGDGPPPGGGFGGPGGQGGFGGPSGFGPPQQGYGQPQPPQQQQGFGQQPPQYGQPGQQPPPGYGQQGPPSGGFGQQPPYQG